MMVALDFLVTICANLRAESLGVILDCGYAFTQIAIELSKVSSRAR